MTQKQFDTVQRAEKWRKAGHMGGTPLANTWRRPGGGHETFCPWCGSVHVHADVSAHVLNEERSAHCLLRTEAIHAGYMLKVLPGIMPNEARKAAAVWPRVHRTAGERLTCDELRAIAKRKYQTEATA
jgi:hypothetical protein